MPIIEVYDEAGQHKLGQGDSDDGLEAHTLRINLYNGPAVNNGAEYALAERLNPDHKVGYMVVNVTDQYTFTLER